MKDKNGNYHIPYLMLLGILFCASNSQVKVQKFFNICQNELNPSISATDKELKMYTPKLFEISYEMMINLFNDSNPESAKAEWISKDCQQIYLDLFEKYLDEVYGENGSKLS